MQLRARSRARTTPSLARSAPLVLRWPFQRTWVEHRTRTPLGPAISPDSEESQSTPPARTSTLRVVHLPQIFRQPRVPNKLRTAPRATLLSPSSAPALAPPTSP